MHHETIVHWELVDSVPPLDAAELHVWRCDLGIAPCRGQWLDGHERRHIANASPAVAHRYCATRSMLRHLLAAYLGGREEAVRLHAGPHGKPCVAADRPFFFNLTHAADAALLAFSRRYEVGIDLEMEREVPAAARIARRVMSDSELAALADQENCSTAFLHLWTRMEARQKCLGQGVFGKRVTQAEVGSASFLAQPGQAACVAWAAPRETPRLRFLDLRET